MAQGVIPFKYEEEKTQTGMTALAGLPVYLDLAKVIGLSKSIKKHLKIRENSQGWSDSQMVLSLVLLNLAGGDCVDDLNILEADGGFCEILRKSETHGLKRKVRRALERRWRKEKKRSVHPRRFSGIYPSFMTLSRKRSGRRQSGKRLFQGPMRI